MIELSRFSPVMGVTDPKSGLKRPLWEYIGYETTTVDEIINLSGLTAAQVSAMLLPLELAGYIRHQPGGYQRL